MLSRPWRFCSSSVATITSGNTTGLPRPFPHPFDHGLSRDGDERLAGKPRGRVTCRDDGEDIHSGPASLRASDAVLGLSLVLFLFHLNG